MTFTMIKIAAALILASAAESAFAYHGGGGYVPPPAPTLPGGIGSLVDLNITSGTFTMSGSGSTFGSISFGPIGFDLVDGYGSHSGLFSWLGNPWNVFTGNGTMTPFGGNNIDPVTGNPITGGPVPSGTATATAISFDLSAFSANWNGNNFNQGHSAVTGTYASATGAFNASWSLVNAEGPFKGYTSTWTVTGVAAAVPEVSTYAMMLVGLGLVGGMTVRRHKANNI
jgi:hypothetical protein